MQLDRYARADDFLAAAGDWLTLREAEHNLILGIAGSLRRDPDQYESGADAERLANPTSNHIYREIGYRPVADALMLTFHPA